MSEDALDTDDEQTDKTFSMELDTTHMKEGFCEEWLAQLDRDNFVSLGLFLSFQFTSLLQKKEIEAAELAWIMIGMSDRTIRE